MHDEALNKLADLMYENIVGHTDVRFTDLLTFMGLDAWTNDMEKALRLILESNPHIREVKTANGFTVIRDVRQFGYTPRNLPESESHLMREQPEDSKSVKGVENKQAASTTNTTAQAQPSDSDTVKGKLLIDPEESLTGANTASFHEQLPENDDFSINDPFPAVPAELKARRQWVCWRKETTRDGKPTKIPYQVNRRTAQSNEVDTWVDYQTVCDHLDNFSGIGFVFSPDDHYCGIDLDDCLDAQDKVKDWANPIVDSLKSVAYGERSPGRDGIKFWTRATLPPEAKNKAYIVKGADAIEAYDRLRYFTVTGMGKGDIGDGQAVIDWLCAEYLSPQPTEQTPQLPRSVPTSGNLNADEVIAHIKASRQAAKFEALMRGNSTGYGSQSENDLALCAVIAFWTQDPAAIDAVFRQSGLMRAKWDERHKSDGSTYGQMTIKEALSGSRETYTQPRQARTTNRRHARRERYGYDRF